MFAVVAMFAAAVAVHAVMVKVGMFGPAPCPVQI